MSPLRASLQLDRGDFALATDLEFPAQGITAVFGVSGSGKTTLLRAIAGLEPSARGHIALGDAAWLDSERGICVPVRDRRIGYVFQEASLFEHLDVAGNVRYGLRWRRPTGSGPDGGGGEGAEARFDRLVELLGIGPLMRRRVDTLSGGERQRVAIARAMAVEPQLLLLDEPLTALDFARRDEIMVWLELLREHIGTPMLYVTHDLQELARLADRVVVMDRGRVVACGEPEAALSAAGLEVAAERLRRLRGG